MANNQSNEKLSPGCVNGCVLIVLLTILFLIGTTFFAHKSPKEIKDEKFAEAYAMAEEFVEKRLISPSTAKFPPDYKQRMIGLPGGRYQVVSYVDSQNGFGAMIRNDFTCVIVYRGNHNWVLESMNFR